MKKCVLIYLWIYIGLFYMIEAGDDDEQWVLNKVESNKNINN